MKTNNILKLYVVPLLLAAFGLSGCVKEIEGRGGAARTDNEVTVVIRVPGSSNGATRAIVADSDDDYRVNRIDILMFYPNDDPDAGKRGRYAGRVFVNGGDITSDGRIKTFTVKMLNHTLDLMILANAREIVDAAEANPATPLTIDVTTKAEAYPLLKATLPERTPGVANSGVWNYMPGSPGYRDFPMWSEADRFDVSSASGTLKVNLVRMLAKMNVQLSDTQGSVLGIYLCNYNSEGYLPSTSTKWKNSAIPTFTPYVNAASGIKKTGTENALLYRNTDITNYGCSFDEIFLFEAQKPDDSSGYLTSTCLIINATYNRESCFYRIDMAYGGNRDNYFDIIRNHYYSIKGKLLGPGYTTLEDAYNNTPWNIETVIVAFEESEMDDITYNGQYQLAVSGSEYDFDYSGSPGQKLRIFTDYPGGWSITTSDSWITVTPGSYNNSERNPETDGFVSKEVTITCAPNGDDNRTGSFVISAGPLRKEIFVTQEYLSPITVSPDEITLEFDAQTPAEESLTVTPEDYDKPWTIVSSNPWLHLSLYDDIDFDSAGNAVTGTGEQTVYIYTTENAGTAPRTCIIRNGRADGPELTTVTQLTEGELWIRITAYDTDNDTDTGTEISTLSFNYRRQAPQAFRISWGGADDIFAELRDDSSAAFEFSQDSDIPESDISTDGETEENGRTFTIGADPTQTAYGKSVVVFTLEGASRTITKELVIVNNSVVNRFSKSYIVWDEANQRLTFAETYERTAEISMAASGLLFKWGSIIALGPTGPDWMPFDHNENVAFNPSGISIYAYDDIPYATDFDGGGINNGSFVTEYGTSGYNTVTGLGDICRYISDRGWVQGRWHMMTFEEAMAYYGETPDITGLAEHEGTPSLSGPGMLPVGIFETEDISDNSGMQLIKSGTIYGPGLANVDLNDSDETIYRKLLENEYGDVIFLPATGYYSGTDNFNRMSDGNTTSASGLFMEPGYAAGISMGSAGEYYQHVGGFCWANGTNGRLPWRGNMFVGMNINRHRNEAWPVRCVLDEDSEIEPQARKTANATRAAAANKR